MRWNAPPPLIGSWGGSQTGAGVKDMVKDVAKGVGGGVKETFTKASPSELPHGIKRGFCYGIFSTTRKIQLVATQLLY